MDDERTGNDEAGLTEVGATDPGRQPMPRTAPSESEPGVDVLAELAARGHEAVNRVLDDLATDPRLTEAIDSLLAVKERLTEAARGARSQLDAGEGESVSVLQARVKELERRLAELEESRGPSSGDSISPESAEDLQS